MADATTEVSALLAICRRIEQVTAQIYRALAAAHCDSDLMRPVWLKTADEEMAHARQFDLLAQAHVQNRDSLAPALTVVQARAGLQRVEQVLQDFLTQPPGIEQALRQMVGMEREYLDFHSHRVVEFSDPELCRLFTALMDADRDHVETLERALSAWIRPGL